MAASHKGAISFGLVHIPIALYTATQDNDIHFNQLCKEDLSRVRYKKTCAGCGKEITNKDVVKGFEYDKDKYVIVMMMILRLKLKRTGLFKFLF
ncbi:MAG: Ku protein [[Clostridium] leptum]